MFTKIMFLHLFLSLAVFMISKTHAQQDSDANRAVKPYSATQTLNLEQCLNLALKNNHQAKISDQALKIAEAQYRQVMSSYWPQISVSANYIHLDESPIFVYPEETSKYEISGLAPVPVEVSVTVPEKRTKIMDQTNGTLSLDFLYPLYLGGRRSALREQAQGQIKIRQLEKRRSDLQIVYDVKERYYGNVLAKILHQLGQETVDRVDVTLELTENMYKNGSGSVSKMDYLKNKMFASSMHAMKSSLENNLELSSSALSFTIADKDGAIIRSTDTELPYTQVKTDLTPYLAESYSGNPDWIKVQEAIKIFDARVDEAKSEYWFNAALIGKLNHIENKYDAGAVSAQDKDFWMVGIGVQLPLFSGFSTKYKVQEMKVRLSELKEKQFMLKDGLALQIKAELLKIESLQDIIAATKEAMDAGVENRDLTERAYSIDMASAEDMIQSQLFESLTIAQYYKALYDHIMAKAKLDFLVGTKVQKTIEK